MSNLIGSMLVFLSCFLPLNLPGHTMVVVGRSTSALLALAVLPGRLATLSVALPRAVRHTASEPSSGPRPCAASCAGSHRGGARRRPRQTCRSSLVERGSSRPGTTSAITPAAATSDAKDTKASGAYVGTHNTRCAPADTCAPKSRRSAAYSPASPESHIYTLTFGK